MKRFLVLMMALFFLPVLAANADDDEESRSEHDRTYIVSSNMFDGQYVAGKVLTEEGVEIGDNNYAYTKNPIPVDAGNMILAVSGYGIRLIRYVTAYDEHMNILPQKGFNGAIYEAYVVPEGVYYIRLTTNLSVIQEADFRINNSKTPAPYDAYQIVSTDNRDLLRLKKESFSLLPSYYVETLSYRQVGELSKGYICLVTDDGTAGLASYTVPLAIEQDIPMTFAVMSISQVFQDEAMKNIVLDAVQNHNCSLAQHGAVLWDELGEKDLNNFFDAEDRFFASLGVKCEGAVVPQHRTDAMVRAVAGGRYGVVRSGYEGLGPGDAVNNSVDNHYDYYTSGARSNLYALSSYNCAHVGTEFNHQAVDYAKENNKILVAYFHEYDIGDEQKAVVEDLIAYAKQAGLEFITLGDIRYVK